MGILLGRPHYPQVCQDNCQALKKKDYVMESVLGFCHCDNTLDKIKKSLVIRKLYSSHGFRGLSFVTFGPVVRLTYILEEAGLMAARKQRERKGSEFQYLFHGMILIAQLSSTNSHLLNIPELPNHPTEQAFNI